MGTVDNFRVRTVPGFTFTFTELPEMYFLTLPFIICLANVVDLAADYNI